MLINWSNHPVKDWKPEQLKEAQLRWGEVMDFPFPQIPPEWDWEEVAHLARKKCEEIKLEFPEAKDVLITGEQSFITCATRLLEQAGIQTWTATSNRKVSIGSDGSKTYYFEFVRFRKLNNQE